MSRYDDENSPATDTLRPAAGPAPARQYLLERVGEAAVVQLYADGFASLPIEQKILIWHLYQAALAGRDIYYDQRYSHSLVVRDVLEEILTHADGIDAGTLDEIARYTKLFWLNSGPHNNLTARKFVLTCAPAAFREAAHAAARGGARFPLAPGETLDALLDRLEPILFNPAVDPDRHNKSPEDGATSWRPSANNLYVGVRMADLEGFDERLPAELAAGEAGRPARRGGLPDRRSDTTARSGRSSGTSRRRSPTRRRRWPRRCARSSGSTRPGEAEDRLAYDIAWVNDRDSPVDTINGFVEVYMDARGMKGAWEALVYYVNRRRRPASAVWRPRRSGSRTACPGRRSTASRGCAASRPTPSTSSSRAASRVRSRRSGSTCRTTRPSASTTAASRCRCRT
jgi:dipeptidyl-peptidase III